MTYTSPLAGANNEPLAGVIEDAAPPSTYAVAAVIEGQRGAVLRAVGLTLARGVAIAPGLWLAGRAFKIEGLRGWKLVGTSLAASSMITLFMFGWYSLGTKLSFLGKGGPK